MDVGIRQLKQHLSEYVERAAAGETIRVTDRGQPKAILAPVPGSGRLAEGIAEKWIRKAEEGERGPVPRAKALRSISEVIAEDRDE
ncbi:MAG TPA: type II toxin-antitoxin system prevent-host-death family antitoxin [Polyangiaceae bacterium]|nr:type II toxin-antitoxin system prevent-host-death family antitoxin [Polyangiaceae bacterium]